MDKKMYRSSFGATMLFSVVQFYQILIRILKSKFVALFLGPAGMGISSLLHSTTDLISALTNFGLKTSGVKTVASANSQNDIEIVSKTIKVLRRLIFLTGLVGTVICALFSPIWSKMSFGDDSYIVSFIIVSIIILFDQLNNGELVLLQGMQKKKMLAQANVIGQTLSLIVTVPLYYYYGVKAIVLVLVLSSFISFTISKLYSSRIRLSNIDVSWKETISIGGEMIKLGFFLSLQFLMGQLVVYIVRNYVSSRGGIEDVGLYSAGTTIVATYLGLVFSAIATDYFPRLASTRDNIELKSAVLTQAEISMLLFAPLIIGFIVFIKPFIIILYSDKFISIEYMLYWSIGATLIQSLGWAASHTLLAKAKPIHFFFNELLAACYSLPLRLIGYTLWGLTGFGVATCVTYFIYLLQEFIVVKKLFGFSYSSTIWKLFFLLNIFVVIAIIIKLTIEGMKGYIYGTILLVVVSAFVAVQLNKRMDIFNYLKSRSRK